MLLWDARVAREATHEARTEAAFDKAEEQASAGNLEARSKRSRRPRTWPAACPTNTPS